MTNFGGNTQVPGAVPTGILSSGTGQRLLSSSIVTLGDSITAPSINGYPSWSALLGIVSALQDNVIYNAGIGGNTSTQMLARFTQDVIAKSPKIVTILAGANDTPTVPFATFKGNLKAMVALAVGAGIIPVLGTLTPRSDIGGVAATTNAWNSWIRAFAAANNYPLIDYYSVLVDPATGAYKTAYDSGDHLHPSALGALVMSQTAAPILSGLNPPPKSLLPSWGSSSTPDGFNLITNPTMFDTNADNTPDGYSWTGTGAGIVTSVTTDPRFLNNAAEAALATPASSVKLQQFVTNVGVGGGTPNVGDTLQLALKIAIDGPIAIPNGKGLTIALFWAGVGSTTTLISGIQQLPTAGGPYVTTATVPVGATGIVLVVTLDCTGGGTANFFVGQVALYDLTQLLT